MNLHIIDNFRIIAMACGRTTPLSLTDLAGLTVLQRLSQKAVRQEHEYMEKWRNKLSQHLANIEENMSLNNVDPTEVIQEVSGKLKEQEEKMRVAREQQRKKRMEEEMMENKRVTRGTKRRAQVLIYQNLPPITPQLYIFVQCSPLKSKKICI